MYRKGDGLGGIRTTGRNNRTREPHVVRSLFWSHTRRYHVPAATRVTLFIRHVGEYVLMTFSITRIYRTR